MNKRDKAEGKDKEEIKDKAEKDEVEGISGWLILPTIGLFIAAAIWSLLGIGLILTISEEPELIILLVAVIMAFLTIYSLVLEFRKKKEFPKWAIVTLWAGFTANAALSVSDGDYSGALGTIASSIIWTWYFNVSKRVKNTFVK